MPNRPPPSESEQNQTETQKAVALQYDVERDTAPRVIAKGRGHVAENILAAAQNNSIPVYQNKSLVNMLMAIDIDREIPPELYKAIAEVMAYIYKMDKKEQARRVANRPRRRII